MQTDVKDGMSSQGVTGVSRTREEASVATVGRGTGRKEGDVDRETEGGPVPQMPIGPTEARIADALPHSWFPTAHSPCPQSPPVLLSRRPLQECSHQKPNPSHRNVRENRASLHREGFRLDV